ncbi:Hypp3240 [Branchiostoma lanceolatum]|uniref:Hypp3240 protein n=1 Tax=Branchiostoma lanceolatum TaxID=7740 RepID=A0A8K0ETR9_BRALA|nr:Hypp3240 [Branchiostoma lanceolatum]
MADERRNCFRLWFSVQRLDLCDDGPVCPPLEVFIPKDADSRDVRRILREKLELNQPDLVMKLRNNRHRPYALEVCRQYQHVSAEPRSVVMPSYYHTIRARVQQLGGRIDRLEHIAPELRNRRNARLEAEMDELDQKLRFLNTRLQEAERYQWQGMFKRHPLW